MKRTKQQSRTSSRSASGDEDDFFAKPKEPEPKWDEIAQKPDDEFVPYALSARFAKGSLIAHSKFGKGVVLGVEGANIQVLFQDGKKKLGHAQS